MESDIKEILLSGVFNSTVDWGSLDPRAQPGSWSVKLLEIISERLSERIREGVLDRPSVLDLISKTKR